MQQHLQHSRTSMRCMWFSPTPFLCHEKWVVGKGCIAIIHLSSFVVRKKYPDNKGSTEFPKNLHLSHSHLSPCSVNESSFACSEPAEGGLLLAPRLQKYSAVSLSFCLVLMRPHGSVQFPYIYCLNSFYFYSLSSQQKVRPAHPGVPSIPRPPTNLLYSSLYYQSHVLSRFAYVWFICPSEDLL